MEEAAVLVEAEEPPACGQSTGCAEDAGGLQEGAARDTVFHNEFSLHIIKCVAAYRAKPLLLALL